MSPTANSVLESALLLSEPERAAIADALLGSLSEESEDFVEMNDEEFAKELHRRSEEMKTNPAACVPWSELKKML